MKLRPRHGGGEGAVTPFTPGGSPQSALRLKRCSNFSASPPQALYSQLLVGLINGSFYALLSLGLAVIFGMLNIINFAHGAQYMMGAFLAWIGLTQLGPWLGNPEFQLNYWVALLLAPLVVGALGMVIERTMLSRLYKLDHLYGLLLTFGIALIIEGLFRYSYGVSGQQYEIPGRAAGRDQSRLHVSAQLSRLGDRGFAGRVLCDVVCDRAHQARLVSARRHRKPDAGAGVRHQRAADDHADLRLRRGARGVRRRDGGADLPR